MNYGDFPLDETIHVFFTTRAFATGIPGTLSTATVAIYEDITATPIQTLVAVTESLNSVAGLNAVPIVATSGNGYEVGKNYHVVIDAGTVDSVSVVGEVVAYFSIGRSAAAVDLANSTDGLGALLQKIPRAILPQTNTAYSDIEFLMVDSTDHVTPKTGLTIGITRSIDGGAFGAGTGTAAEVANGVYQYDASQADMNGTIITFRYTGTAADDTFLTVRTAA